MVNVDVLLGVQLSLLALPLLGSHVIQKYNTKKIVVEMFLISGLELLRVVLYDAILFFP